MSESDEQKAIISWFRTMWPEHAQALRVSQSGGFKGKGRKGAIRMAKAKAEGAVTGEADIAILIPRGQWGSFVMEYKKEGGYYKVTPSQQKYLDYHNSIGNCACACRGIEAAKAAIIAYMSESQACHLSSP